MNLYQPYDDGNLYVTWELLAARYMTLEATEKELNRVVEEEINKLKPSLSGDYYAPANDEEGE